MLFTRSKYLQFSTSISQSEGVGASTMEPVQPQRAAGIAFQCLSRSSMFNLILPKDGDWPTPRSGHRTFVDNGFLYVIGGYTNDPEDAILREMWKFNVKTHTWNKCNLPSNFPQTLASFACQSSGDGSFMVYGGTGFPFGRDLDEAIYKGRIIGNNVGMSRIDPIGNKPGCYGHVLIFDPARNKTFSVGGTNGEKFNLDVHALECNNVSGEWEWEEYATFVQDIGRYRMEAILENDRIYIFGGGTKQRTLAFERLPVFNIERKIYEIICTKADPVHGYPTPRRCHSLVQWGRDVIIAGGCHVYDKRNNVILGCVWSFNLDTYLWKRIGDLPIPVYFHDASITPQGKMFIFGGVSHNGRIASLQTLWMGQLARHSASSGEMMKRLKVSQPNVTSSATLQPVRPALDTQPQPEEEPALTAIDSLRFQSILNLVDEEEFVHATKQLPGVCFSWLLDFFGLGLQYLIDHQATATKRRLKRRDEAGITHLVESRFKQLQLTFTCIICGDVLYTRYAISCVRAPGSGAARSHEKHFFCRGCMIGYAKNAVEMASIARAGLGLKCIQPDCNNGVFLYAHVVPLLQGPSRELLEEKLDEEALNASGANVERCPHCPFAAIVELPISQQQTFLCIRCGLYYCRNCKRDWSIRHVGKTCKELDPEFIRRQVENILSERAVGLIPHCPGCHRPIEKNGGCNDMHCTCGLTFHYVEPRVMSQEQRTAVYQQQYAAARGDPAVIAELNKINWH